MNRELLKEARYTLEERTGYYYERGVAHQSDLPHCMCRECIDKRIKALYARIDAALSEPDMDAMEVLRKVRETTWLADSKYDPRPVVRNKLTDSEAAALIESYGRRVPRAMLVDVWDHATALALGAKIKSDDIFLQIAARHGVKLEDKE